MERISEASSRFKSRIAGSLYLLIIIGALFAPFDVAPSGMIRGDAGLPATAQILASKPLYVFGGAAHLVVGACDIGVALIFYGLLKPVSRGLALLAASFRLVFVAIANANVLNQSGRLRCMIERRASSRHPRVATEGLVGTMRNNMGC